MINELIIATIAMLIIIALIVISLYASMFIFFVASIFCRWLPSDDRREAMEEIYGKNKITMMRR